MKKNIFEEAYNGIQAAKRAYYAAADEAGQNEALALCQKALEPIEKLKGTELRIWKAYEASMDCDNMFIDFNEPISDEEARNLVTCMRDYGFDAFTFSSTWSGAAETAWVFQKAGCKLVNLIEINRSAKAFMRDECEKSHDYLFKIMEQKKEPVILTRDFKDTDEAEAFCQSVFGYMTRHVTDATWDEEAQEYIDIKKITRVHYNP